MEANRIKNGKVTLCTQWNKSLKNICSCKNRKTIWSIKITGEIGDICTRILIRAVNSSNPMGIQSLSNDFLFLCYENHHCTILSFLNIFLSSEEVTWSLCSFRHTTSLRVWDLTSLIDNLFIMFDSAVFWYKLLKM